ncbi:MAG: hypothetical protein ACK5B6_06840 [Bacteroidia bacterium]|jgi:hypothetical protein
MNAADTIRNSIIDRLLAISNTEYLKALYKLVENSSFENDKIKLSETQKMMLLMSENDIVNGKLIDNNQLEKEDLKWLKDQ